MDTDELSQESAAQEGNELSEQGHGEPNHGSDQLGDVLGQAIATAPGDIPLSLVVERARSVKRQFRHDNTISPLAPRPGEDVKVSAVSGD